MKITHTKDKVMATKITRNICNCDPITGGVVEKNCLGCVLQNNQAENPTNSVKMFLLLLRTFLYYCLKIRLALFESRRIQYKYRTW